MKELTLYARIGSRVEKCSLGQEHKIEVLAVKRVHQVGTYTGTNGYEEFPGEIFADAQGREYRKHITIDFHNNVYYLRPRGDGKNDFFYTSPRAATLFSRVAVDLLGRRLT